VKSNHLSAKDLEDLLKAVAWISSAEVAFFAKKRPQAIRWMEIWAELRQSYGPMFDDEGRHRSSVVLCWRNRKTKKVTEKTIFVGSGDCPICTATDLLTQLRAEIPEAFAVERCEGPPEIRVRASKGSFLVGLFGSYVVGTA